MTLPIDNKVIIFLYRRSRTFFTANGGLFVFAVFQPATGQARLGVAEADNSRHGFLCLYHHLTGVAINGLNPQLDPP